jgi:glucose-6-phosphate 1-dehydrogenase
LIEGTGRKWLEVINRAVLERVPMFQDTSSVFLHGLALVLKPVVYVAGDYVVKKGDPGSEMYFIARGEVDVVNGEGRVVRVLGEGNFFGETSLITSEPRSAHVRARTQCDLFVLEKSDFVKVLKDHPKFARSILETSRRIYQLPPDAEKALAAQIVRDLKGDD